MSEPRLTWKPFTGGKYISGSSAVYKGQAMWAVHDKQYDEWRFEVGDSHSVDFSVPAQSEAHAKAAAEAFTKVLDALRD